MNEDYQRKISSIANLISIQRNCLKTDTRVQYDYMHGLLNGLIMAQSVFADIEPNFERSKRKAFNVRHKSKKR